MAPTVTVAIPLHASAPWVDNVEACVRALPPAVTEIIVSDQTSLDDAAERLSALLADDPRVTVVAGTTGIGWEDHHQLLAEQATGDLFMWMPHDDRFEPTWVPTLIDALHAHPEAWLAFGRMVCVEVDGTTPAGTWPPPLPTGVIRGRALLDLMVRGELGIPVRGLFRRPEVLAAGIRLTPATTYLGSDLVWVLAVGLRSALVYDDSTVTWKRVFAGSASGSWPPQARERRQAALRTLHAHGPDGLQGLGLRWHLRLRYWRAQGAALLRRQPVGGEPP